MLLALFLAIQIQAQTQNARVTGQVISLAGAPLKKATVRLQGLSQGPSSPPTNYSATSDGGGKFLFEDVVPGKYVLIAQRAGYISQQFGAKTPGGAGSQVSLDTGQELKDLVLTMTPQAMIFGKVVDEDGEPLSGYLIWSSRWSFVNGKRQMQGTGNGTSQADGTFVLGSLRSGLYYLSAENRSNLNSFGVERAGTKAPQESYLKTYFPNALDATSAAAIDVAEGAEVRGIEMHVRRGRVFEVRGRIDSGPSAPKFAGLAMIPKGASGNFTDQRQTQIQGKEGVFQFKNVPPGTYILQTQYAQLEAKDPTGEFTKTTPLVARIEVTVADQNIENLVVPLSPGMEIRGSIKTEGADPTSANGAKDQPWVYLRNTEPSINGGNNSAQIENDGTFRLGGIVPGVYRVSVNLFAGNTYVKGVKFGGQDVNGKDLDLTASSGGEMQIVLSANGAELSGTVRDADGKAVPSAAVQICDKAGEVAKTANADQNGAFDLKGLAPGEYKVFAWEDRGDGIISDPEFRKAFESKSTEVKLSEGSHGNVEPVMFTKAAMDLEAAKVR